jgi:hypothetical protein
MSYFSDHYPLYVPPHISGTEKVRITIMKPTPTEEMEQRIKMRYAFAMSSFSRMYGVNRVNSTKEIVKFCRKWSETEEQINPLCTLTEVDFYFRDLWQVWGGHV